MSEEFNLPTIGIGTSRQFREHEAECKKINAKAYWLFDDGLDIAQDIVYFPYDVYSNIRHKLHNIFISQSHCIPTGLPKGEWYDCDTRLQEGLFKLIVDFVEHEKAHMQDIFHEDDEAPIADRREAGIAYLDWEISIKDEVPHQSEAAQEIKDIYIWIKDVYPNRPEVYDITGWSDYCDSKRDILDNEDEDEETRARVSLMLENVRTIEELYENEDTEMLTRILKVRKNLWT